MRRVFAFCFACLFAVSFSQTAFALEDALPAAALVDPTIPCESAILIEETTGRVLFEKDADTPLPPASITKIMTLLLVMEALDRGDIALADTVTCSPHASSMGGTQIWLEPGEEMTVDELLRATAIASANDAAVALGEHLAGSEAAFVSEMNERAAALGCTNTTFKNATGLDSEGHLTTARDIAKMSAALLSHPKIKEYTTVWTDTLRGGETELTNTNKLVRHYKGATGLKTGTTDDAKYCLAASAERDGLSLIAVVLSAPTTNERFGAARGLLDYGFAEYEMRALPSMPDMPQTVPVKKGAVREVSVSSDATERLLLEKGAGDLEWEFSVKADLTAPVRQGDAIGEGVITQNGVVVCRFSLTAGEDVEEMELKTAFSMALRALSAMKKAPF